MRADGMSPSRDDGEAELLVAPQRRFEIANGDDNVVDPKEDGGLGDEGGSYFVEKPLELPLLIPGGEAKRDVLYPDIKVIL